MRLTLALIVVLGLVVAWGVAAPDARAAEPDRVAQGRALFEANCALCHGADGQGGGPAAYLLSPKPRDFTEGIYKLKSAPPGSIPTDADIFRTITRGIPGTSMPSWATLSEESRWALVAYVKTFSDRFTDEEPEEPIEIGPEPPADADSIERGRELYGLLQCAACHGETGRGDGPSSAGLFDNWGYPIRAFNFTGGYKMRGGGSGAEIYRTFIAGLEGTPMPAYEGLLTNEQAWDLVHYIQSLGVAPAPYQPERDAAIVVTSIAGPVPPDPTDHAWQKTPPAAIPVRPLWSRDDAPDYVLVRALANATDVGFMVEWTDGSANDTVLRPEDFRDAVAVQFPLKPVAAGEELPFYGMGATAEDTVNIWHWKADWQRDLAGFADIGAQHPGLANDLYTGDAIDPALYATARAAGNLLATPSRRTAVEDLNAQGQGTLTAQAAADQNVQGRGVWTDGIWRVAFTRRRTSREEFDAQFTDGALAGLRIAVAVWDGAAGDRDGQKLVSEWHPVAVARPGKGAAEQSAARN